MLQTQLKREINSLYSTIDEDQNHQTVPLAATSESHCMVITTQTFGRQNMHSCIYERHVKINNGNVYFRKFD